MLFTIILITLAQYLINCAIYWKHLGAFASIPNLIEEFKKSHFLVWTPIIGFVLQILYFCVIIYSKIEDKIHDR